MYQRILVPLDGSGFSEQMIAPAAALAKATGSELMLLRGIDLDGDEAGALHYLETQGAPVGAKGVCVRAGTDTIATAIRDEARRVPGTLVAMCSHGHSGVARAVFGSVALQVLRELGEPLLALCPQQQGSAAPSKIARIVVPLDGSAASETIVPQAAALAKWLGARLIVVNVLEPAATRDANVASGDVLESAFVRSKAQEFEQCHGMSVGWEVLHGDPKQAIPRFVRSLGDAMLAMTTHGRTGLRGVITGSVTAQCLRDSAVPVFTRLP